MRHILIWDIGYPGDLKWAVVVADEHSVSLSFKSWAFSLQDSTWTEQKPWLILLI